MRICWRSSNRKQATHGRPSARGNGSVHALLASWTIGKRNRFTFVFSFNRSTYDVYSHTSSTFATRFCLCCLGATTAAAAGWLTPREVFAQASGIVEMIRGEAAKAKITVHKLRGNVSVLEGSGGNIAVLTGKDGKLLVDAGITATKPRIVEALDGLDDKPIKRLINTHWHFDHCDGNEWVHAAGATILAHDNTLRHLASTQRVADWSFDFPPSPAGALPSELISADKTLHHNGATLSLKVHQPAHTDGDISVYFTEADVLHTGDIWWNGIYPFIDYSTGGAHRRHDPWG